MEGNGTVRFDGKEYVSDHYTPCFFVALYLFIINIVIGPSLMFYSMKGKHDRQTLLMLPASNLEKYLMRYSTWILLVPIVLLAFFAADLIQYIVNFLLGRDYTTFVTTNFLYDKHMVIWRTNIVNELSREGSLRPYMIGLLVHSVYALGATFFRSHKFNAIFTTIALIIFVELLMWASYNFGNADNTLVRGHYTIGYLVSIGLTMVNFWLSYKLFCRTQVISKYVNI
jgi:hypothetical protein